MLQLGVGFLLGTIGWSVWTYNRLTRLRQHFQEAWSGVEVQLKRRHDLIPNLVAAVRAYRDYERQLFESVAQLRAAAANAGSVPARGAAETALSSGIRNLLVIAEAYPDLKASNQFLALQNQLAETENEIQLARRYFNGTVRDYNILCQSFPSILVARSGGFAEAEYFELESAIEGNVPQVAL